MSQQVRAGQKTTGEIWFSPTMWVPRKRTQVIRFGNKCLHPLGHLTSPLEVFLNNQCLVTSQTNQIRLPQSQAQEKAGNKCSGLPKIALEVAKKVILWDSAKNSQLSIDKNRSGLWHEPITEGKAKRSPYWESDE